MKQRVGLRLPASNSFPPARSGEGVILAPLHRLDHRTSPASPAAGRFTVAPSGRARQRAGHSTVARAPSWLRDSRVGARARARHMCASVGSGPHCTAARFYSVPPASPTHRYMSVLRVRSGVSGEPVPQPGLMRSGYPASNNSPCESRPSPGEEPHHPSPSRVGGPPP